MRKENRKENEKENKRERKRKRDTMRTRLKIMSRRYMNNARMRKSLNGRYITPTSFSSTVACAYTCVYIIARCYTLYYGFPDVSSKFK